MGDHPVLPTESLRYTGPARKGLHRLSPFRTCEKCTDCATLSLFHADKEQGGCFRQASITIAPTRTGRTSGYSWQSVSDRPERRRRSTRPTGPPSNVPSQPALGLHHITRSEPGSRQTGTPGTLYPYECPVDAPPRRVSTVIFRHLAAIATVVIGGRSVRLTPVVPHARRLAEDCGHHPGTTPRVRALTGEQKNLTGNSTNLLATGRADLLARARRWRRPTLAILHPTPLLVCLARNAAAAERIRTGRAAEHMLRDQARVVPEQRDREHARPAPHARPAAARRISPGHHRLRSRRAPWPGSGRCVRVTTTRPVSRTASPAFPGGRPIRAVCR